MDPELPSVDSLQFRRAQPIGNAEGRSCEACKLPITGEYYQVQNHVICPSCASRIRAGQQSAKPVPLGRAVIYGIGAAIAGSLLYAIPLAMGTQIGIVALLVGWMVGKAIRTGSYGTGGRPQQILAVVLTYFAISLSFFPAVLFHAKRAIAFDISMVPLIAFAGPFLELRTSPAGGLISLFILFVGLQRAWALTARHEIMVTGPYS